MTNGEKIKVILKPRKDQIKIYGDWVEIEIQSLAINFSCSLEWWNAEYKEPTTKNDLGVDCIDRKATLDAIIKRLGIKNEAYLLEAERVIYQQILAMPSVTPQEPILDKIKEDIQFIKDKCLPNNIAEEYEQKGLQEALDIIDKYKAESEDNNADKEM